MINIDYAFIQEIFDLIWDETYLSDLTLGLKAMAIAFLLIRLTYMIVKSTAQQKTFDLGMSKIEMPISIWNVLNYTALALLIAFYDTLLFSLDHVWGFFVSYFAQFQSNTITVDLAASVEPVPSDMGDLEAMKAFSLEAIQFLTNPTLWLLGILKVIIWLFDVVIYGFFISQRFFVLLLLKLTGPFAICLALLPGFQGIFSKWLGLYTRWYLLIIPYLLVNLIINGFLDAYDLLFDEFGAGSSFAMDSVKNTVKTPLFLMLAMLKFSLYYTSKKIYEQLIDVNIKLED